MQRRFEKLLDNDRFRMPALWRDVWPLVEAHASYKAHLPNLKARLGEDYAKLACAILRHVFLIELVKVPKIETTKFRVRWYEQLKDDPRFCPFEECLEIGAELLSSLDDWLEIGDNAQVLKHAFAFSILPYEIPLDYVVRPVDTIARIHRKGNLAWITSDTVLRTLKLRRYLTASDTSPDAEFFKRVLDDKIKIKTHLTDRAQTGLHKTNREKRWETHPRSVQFATRRSCMEIEYVLITQLCAFDGFPDKAKKMLQDEKILPAEFPAFRCPITLDHMSFLAFRDELLNPIHGKSNFQVGHLYPLKLEAEAGASAGHTADNISWISADGNRIQGSLGLSDVRSLLKRIATNYAEAGSV